MAAIQVLRSLLLDEQVGIEALQEELAGDASACLDAFLDQSALLRADRPLAPTVAELRAAVLQLAKQGYLEHSRGIRLSRLGGGAAKSSQPSAKTVRVVSVTGVYDSSLLLSIHSHAPA